MQTDQNVRYALILTADAMRYVHVQILTIVSIMVLFVNEWHSQDLKGNEIQSQRGSILRS
jgi:hypothetical protein